MWQNDNTSSVLDPECAPLIERAMKLWVTEKRDSWVACHTMDGADYSLLASTITSAMLTTAAQRLAATQRDKEREDERKEHRRLAGFIESEP